MYEELVKRLRELQILTEHCDEQSCLECKNRKLCDKYDNKTVNRTYKEAADAIEATSNAYQMMAEAYEAEVTKSRWTPVTEWLPDAEKESYWVCTDTGYQCECRWTNNRFGIGESDEWGWSIFDIPQYQKVVAWMPLPSPPVEE